MIKPAGGCRGRGIRGLVRSLDHSMTELPRILAERPELRDITWPGEVALNHYKDA